MNEPTYIIDLKDKTLRLGQNGIKHQFTNKEVKDAWIEGEYLFYQSGDKMYKVLFIVVGHTITFLTEMPSTELKPILQNGPEKYFYQPVDDREYKFDFADFFFNYLPIRLFLTLAAIILIIFIISQFV